MSRDQLATLGLLTIVSTAPAVGSEKTVCDENPAAVKEIASAISSCDKAIAYGTTSNSYIEHVKKNLTNDLNSVCDDCSLIDLRSCLTEALYENYSLIDLNFSKECY